VKRKYLGRYIKLSTMDDCVNCGNCVNCDNTSLFGGVLSNILCLWVCSDLTNAAGCYSTDVEKVDKSVNNAAPDRVNMSREFELNF